jgi:hypothetical protein
MQHLAANIASVASKGFMENPKSFICNTYEKCSETCSSFASSFILLFVHGDAFNPASHCLFRPAMAPRLF